MDPGFGGSDQQGRPPGPRSDHSLGGVFRSLLGILGVLLGVLADLLGVLLGVLRGLVGELGRFGLDLAGAALSAGGQGHVAEKHNPPPIGEGLCMPGISIVSQRAGCAG
ncbi:MAG: hypothetical protein H0X45_00955 [Planctomycetes bacterium]|nr:hypothetical protein [Planctomycetota bacterium]